MGIFDFPRINVKGLLRIDVGTANNDDYSAAAFPPDSPFAGQPMRLADSVRVQPLTYGMSDDDWIRWVQQPHEFVQTPSTPSPSKPCQQAGETAQTGVADLEAAQIPTDLRDAMTRAEAIHALPAPPVAAARVAEEESADPSAAPATAPTRLLPAEWNYYGSMGLAMENVEVLGVTTGPDQVETDHALVGSVLSFDNRPDSTGRSTGMLIDVNPESVPCSQVFADFLTLARDGEAILSGPPTKACTRWINFQRNTGLTGPNGASGTFQHTVPLAAIEDQPIRRLLPDQSPDGRPLAGVVLRYVIYRAIKEINTFKYDQDQWFEQIQALYAEQGLNPDIGQICGTLAPWFEGEPESAPVGRLLQTAAQPIPVPAGGNGTCFGLAPAVLRFDGARASVDLATSLFDRYDDPDYDPSRTDTNPKYDFGELRLGWFGDAGSVDFGPIAYQDTADGDRRGWLFDLPLPELPAGITPDVLAAGGEFRLSSPDHGLLLVEQASYLISDQSCIYGEQDPRSGATTDRFVNLTGTPEPATVRLFVHGVEVRGGAAPPLGVWQYDTTPNQVPGARALIATDLRPGDPLQVAVDQPGNRLFTFTLPGEPDPPPTSSDLNLMLIPQINLRLLPNDVDYSEYYEDPGAPQPIGNARLTFDVVYDQVFRNYYLLYPAMNRQVPLNSVRHWADPQMAQLLLSRIAAGTFPQAIYMPRTRDLSDSRRTLVAAWCRKIIRDGGEPPPA